MILSFFTEKVNIRIYKIGRTIRKKVLPRRSYFCSAVKRHVVRIEIVLVHLVREQPQPFAEALEVHDLALAQKADDVRHFGIVHKAQNVVVGRACLLLCYNFAGAEQMQCFRAFFVLFRLKIPVNFDRSFSRFWNALSDFNIVNQRVHHLSC